LTVVSGWLTFVNHMTIPALTPEKVRAALIAGDGSPKRAAAILGVSRQTIHEWMRKHSIRVERRVVVVSGSTPAEEAV
jgi:DNA-binding NtrC family response regulator